MKIEEEFKKELIDDYGVSDETIDEVMTVIDKFPTIYEEYIYDIVITAVEKISSDKCINNIPSDERFYDEDVLRVTLSSIFDVWCMGAHVGKPELEMFKRTSFDLVRDSGRINFIKNSKGKKKKNMDI